MKKLLSVSFLAALLAACADSGQGGAPRSESETINPGVTKNQPTGIPQSPVVSTNAVFETPAKPVTVPEGSQAEPSGTAKVQQSGGASQEGQSAPAEQGTQITPEPRTGDDANPESVNPRQ